MLKFFTQETGRIVKYGLYEEVAQNIIGVYARASTCLALMQIHSILNKIKRRYEKQLQLNRSSTSLKKQKEFETELDNLFEVLVCQCPMWKNDDDLVQIDCKCPLKDKIPTAELGFVYAQRYREGKTPAIQIGNIDISTTKKLQKNADKKVTGPT